MERGGATAQPKDLLFAVSFRCLVRIYSFRRFALTESEYFMMSSSAFAAQRFPAGQNLLIDADDTLWENNIYFERAIANFISFLNHHEYTPDRF